MHVPKVTLSLKKWSQSLWPSRAQFSSGKLINARWPCQFSKWVWMKTNNRNIVKLASSLAICERKSGWSLLLVFCNHISSWSWWLAGGKGVLGAKLSAGNRQTATKLLGPIPRSSIQWWEAYFNFQDFLVRIFENENSRQFWSTQKIVMWDIIAAEKFVNG